MKRKLIMVACGILAVLALIVGAFKAGVYHAMVDSEFWILEFDDADPYDYAVHVLIDGTWYEHGLWVG